MTIEAKTGQYTFIVKEIVSLRIKKQPKQDVLYRLDIVRDRPILLIQEEPVEPHIVSEEKSQSSLERYIDRFTPELGGIRGVDVFRQFGFDYDSHGNFFGLDWNDSEQRCRFTKAFSGK